MALLQKRRRLKMSNNLNKSIKLVQFINNYEITDSYWDIDDPELMGKFVEEIPEHKKNYEKNTIGNALSDFDYALLTGKDYKEKFSHQLRNEETIEPWDTDNGHESYSILDVPDHFMVLLDLNDPVQPFYWGKDYKALLNEMNSLGPFGDFSSERKPSEEGWDREVDFDPFIDKAETYLKENKVSLIDSEEFSLLLQSEPLYTPLYQTQFKPLHLLTDKQLEQLLNAQIEQLQNTREGLDQAAYEVIEELEDVVEIDCWIKDLKIEITNRNLIFKEQDRRVHQNKEEKNSSKSEEISSKKSPRI